MRAGAKPAIALAAFVAGCNLILGIDEQGPRPEAVDAGEAGPPLTGDRCNVDGDCAPPNGCYTGRCDTVVGACVYELCAVKDRLCTRGRCNLGTMTCEGESPIGFAATTYDAPGLTLGCGRDTAACVAAAFPFLFVGTPTGVVALVADDLGATVARTITISGPPIVPARIVASGRRLWILGAAQGTTPPYTLPIATIDVPADPTATSLALHVGSFAFASPNAGAFVAPNGGLWLTTAVDTSVYAARIDAPIGTTGAIWPETAVTDGGLDASEAGADGGLVPPPSSEPTIVMRRVPLPAGGAIVAASGDRLVVHRAPGTINLVTGAGTTAPELGPDQPIAPAPIALGAPAFTAGPEGTTLMSVAVNGDVAAECNCTTKARHQWLFTSAAQASVEPNLHVDAETYVNPNGVPPAPCRTCTYFSAPSSATWIDGASALVLSAASDPVENRASAAVRLVTRDPLGGSEARRFRRLPTASPRGDLVTDRVALASSAGYGYLVVANAEGTDLDVTLFDPRCDAR